MSWVNDVQLLRGELEKGLEVLLRMETYLVDFQERKLNQGNPGTDEAMVIAQAISNYYTCAETAFLRISRFFENSLPRDRWHQALLEKMTISVPDHRPKVISDQTYRCLLELLKFRHFTRYYFELDYDWEKLDYLLRKFNGVRVRLREDLADFEAFLSDLAGSEES